MSDVVIRARCALEFAATAENAGRIFHTGYRPNHFISELGYNVLGHVTFEGMTQVRPGEKTVAKITFVGDRPFGELMRPGFE